MSTKEQIDQELTKLTESQLQEVAGFITFVRFRAKLKHLFTKDISQFASLYSEFAEEDRFFAEEGMIEYAELIRKEDLA